MVSLKHGLPVVMVWQLCREDLERHVCLHRRHLSPKHHEYLSHCYEKIIGFTDMFNCILLVNQRIQK